jgi:hypothetical protein
MRAAGEPTPGGKQVRVTPTGLRGGVLSLLDLI